MIFIDCSLPRSVADQLKRERGDVIWLGDRFDLNVKDYIWLAEAGEQGWLIVTHDKNIRHRPSEMRALLENNVGCFVLVYRDNLNREQVYELLASALDEMQRKFDATAFPLHGHQKPRLQRVCPRPSPLSRADP